MPTTKTFVTHLECSVTGDRYAADELHNLSAAGKPLLARYDLDALARSVNKQMLQSRPPELWRYREFLPIRQAHDIVRLGEVMTPILASPYLQRRLGMSSVMIKDEGRLPTGSFKARGVAVAVSMAKALGVTRMAMPTNGNAGAALAAYGSRAGIESYIFCPDDTPQINVNEINFQGAHVWKVNGLINDCGRIVADGKAAMNWFDVSTLKEPYRIEGKKTMGLELAEQLNWQLPDVILYPTGGGTGLIGMWKAFAELEAIGWIGPKRPRMVAVQASGCAPIVKAFNEGQSHAELWQNAHTQAAGIRVPAAIGDFLILDAVRQSGGFACAVDDEAILEMQAQVTRQDGLLLCPEGAATAAALAQEVATGRISKDERVLLFNCASGLKYPMPTNDRYLDIGQPIDFAQLQQQAAGSAR
ncbi:MAG: threonine synthase [SAR86 cluster bacterium]|uniref:Threonine synthase n=1 Tax=SAR86 cluster bacterium TaxID=2030880 RepID=A0A972VYK8_9GAMM|nr:threonine synthase [SAR86 cluster bacterium]